MKSFQLLMASIALRKVKASLPRLRGKAETTLDLTGVREELDSLLEKVTAKTAGQAGPVLEAYVDTHVAEWLMRAQARHGTVASELDLLAVRVAEVKELYQVHHDDQAGVLNDLEGAVSHALERVSDPDTPYYKPEPRNKRGGGNG